MDQALRHLLHELSGIDTSPSGSELPAARLLQRFFQSPVRTRLLASPGGLANLVAWLPRTSRPSSGQDLMRLSGPVVLLFAHLDTPAGPGSRRSKSLVATLASILNDLPQHCKQRRFNVILALTAGGLKGGSEGMGWLTQSGLLPLETIQLAIGGGGSTMGQGKPSLWPVGLAERGYYQVSLGRPVSSLRWTQAAANLNRRRRFHDSMTARQFCSTWARHAAPGQQRAWKLLRWPLLKPFIYPWLVHNRLIPDLDHLVCASIRPLASPAGISGFQVETVPGQDPLRFVRQLVKSLGEPPWHLTVSRPATESVLPGPYKQLLQRVLNRFQPGSELLATIHQQPTDAYWLRRHQVLTLGFYPLAAASPVHASTGQHYQQEQERARAILAQLVHTLVT